MSLPLYRPSVTQVLSRFAYTVLVTVIWIVAICRWWSLGIVRSAKFERKRAQRYGALGQLTPRRAVVFYFIVSRLGKSLLLHVSLKDCSTHNLIYLL